MESERRQKRSVNVHQALELQLNATAERAGFDSVILTEDQGIPVAGAGNVNECEEYAALAPQLVPGNQLWQGKIAIDNGPQKEVTVAPLHTEIGDLYVCAVGGDSEKVMAELLLSCRGVNRILA